ncbi:filamentous hemagglutinin N-terminal domain-containing protein [Falsiroseomonas sp. HW251]|uniref:two-partner secretion domain-containing protein n=1 Tax=Falsiroseomonas sp. HW251 TaxID=3390998 RepID=UPI003D31F524
MGSLRPILLATTALLPVAAFAQAPNAQPQGGSVVAGQATISRAATRTQVNQASDRAVVEWRSFDIGSNQQVDIRQPGASSFSLQRVTGPDPSQIAGRLTSNGGVALVNPNGVTFHAGAQVDVASLIATASDITNRNLMDGRMVFDGQPRAGARVENRGTITVRDRGMAALVGPVAANSGTIRARLGRVAIAGAEAFALDLAGDGLLSLDVTRQVTTAPSGAAALATNTGTIEAEGGQVLLTAQAASGLLETLVAAGGTINAGSIVANAPNGGVVVPAGATLQAARATIGAAAASTIGAPAALSARTTVERGATIRAEQAIVHSAERTRMSGTIEAPGGRVEVSSRGELRLDGWIRAAGGSVLLDPVTLDIVATASNANEVSADFVNTTAGSLTLQADSRIRVLSAVDRDAGPLTLQTTNTTAQAGDGIAIQAPLAVAGDLRLLTAGEITQTAALNVTTLRAEAGRVRLEAASNVIRALDGGKAATRFDVASGVGMTVDAAITADAMRLTSAGALEIRAPVTATGTLELVGLGGVTQSASGAAVRGGTLVLESLSAPILLNGAGNAGALGDVSAPAGVTLRVADGLVVNGVLNALGATATLKADAGSITQGSDASRVLADSLVARAPQGSVILDGANNLIARIAGQARDDFTVEAGGPLTVAGRIEAARIGLSATGDLDQDTDALLVTPSLRARATGSVLLTDPLNEVTGLATSSAGNLFSLATMPTLTITGLVAAPQVALLSGGGIAQTTGTVEANNVRLTALTGSVAMEGSNQVFGLGASSAATSFAFATTTSLEVGGAVSAGTTLSLRGASINAGADLDAASVTLRATDGGITQDGGRIATAALRAEATEGVRLEAAKNAIAAVSGAGGPVFRIATSGALAPDDIVADAVALTGGAMTQPVNGLGIRTATLDLASTGRVDLSAATNAIAALGAVTAPGGLVLRTSGALQLTAPISVPDATLTTGGDLIQTPLGTLGAGTLRLDVGGGVQLTEAGNAVPRLLSADATGELRLTTSGALSLEGAIRSGDTMALTAIGALTQPGGVITAPVLFARSVAGAVTLDRANLVDALGGGAAGRFSFTQGGAGPLRLANLIAAPEVSLTIPGALFEAGGNIRAPVLALDAGGDVQLEGPGHVVGAIVALRANSLRLLTSGPIEITGEAQVAGQLALQAGAIAINAPVRAGAALLVASAGDVAQAAAITAVALEVHASGNVALNAVNAIGALTNGSADAGAFALLTTTPLRVSGNLSAETVTLRALGEMTLDGVGLRAGSAVLLAAPGGIAAGRQMSLAPMDDTRLPVLMLDTRRANGLTAIPAFVQPDLPGAAPASQPTQLGQFGAPTSAAAGTAAFDIAAGASPVFILLDGAPSVGAVEAGRLGVLGQGASAFLVGAIGGVGGEAAAALILLSGGGDLYRFNNCPMGVGGCGAAPPGGGGTAGGSGTGSGTGAGGGSGGSGGSASIATPRDGNAPAGTVLFRPVPVRAGLFSLDGQGRPGLPQPEDRPEGWWLAPLPWPFVPLFAFEDEENRRR